MSDPSRPLSPRHQRFVAEYLKDGNAAQAYVRAGILELTSRVRDGREQVPVKLNKLQALAALAKLLNLLETTARNPKSAVKSYQMTAVDDRRRPGIELRARDKRPRSI